MDDASDQITQNFQPIRRVAKMYAETVLPVLQRRYSGRHGDKLLARAACVTTRTARNWIDGHCAPYGEQLLNLMAHCEGLTEEILQAVEEIKKCGQ